MAGLLVLGLQVLMQPRRRIVESKRYRFLHIDGLVQGGRPLLFDP